PGGAPRWTWRALHAAGSCAGSGGARRDEAWFSSGVAKKFLTDKKVALTAGIISFAGQAIPRQASQQEYLMKVEPLYAALPHVADFIEWLAGELDSRALFQ